MSTGASATKKRIIRSEIFRCLRSMTFCAVVALAAAGFSVAQLTPLSAGAKGSKALIVHDSLPAGTEAIDGMVVYVHDGQTLSVATKDNSFYLIRIDGIYSPGSRQPFAEEAKLGLSALVEGMEVFVRIKGRAGSGPYRGAVFTDGLDVGLELIKKGMAWSCDPKAKTADPCDLNVNYRVAESAARTNKIGLWGGADPVPPWRSQPQTFTDLQVVAAQDPVATANRPSTTPATSKVPDKPSPGSSAPAERNYILGPRGGCYFISSSGNKVYVQDKSLCRKSN